MIAKITRGKNPGDIGAYLHGPGKANEHVHPANGKLVPGGVVIASNIGVEGHLDPSQWAGELRKAMHSRPEIRNPVWHASLRNTATDPILTDDAWADMGQSFAEDMGFADHPWVMVRHGSDHVHVVVSRVSDLGEVWHGRNDRRAAQSACTRLEQEHGLEQAPRRRVQKKVSVGAEREQFKDKAQKVEAGRAVKERERLQLAKAMAESRRLQKESFPFAPNPRAPERTPVANPRNTTHRQYGRDEGIER
ncbi:MAG: relaxase/mobilization nuclease domain-containing protein [Micrococcaceae bacterium]|nr:relaxase/mobilization nuclease domain-containing protein [Micrococcaceae bacterium]